MAAKHRKIDPRLWDDEVFDSLEDPHEVIAALWMFTSKHVCRAGVLVASLGEAADKLRVDTVSRAWETLCGVVSSSIGQCSVSDEIRSCPSFQGGSSTTVRPTRTTSKECCPTCMTCQIATS